MKRRVQDALYFLLFKTLSQGMAFASGVLSIRAVTVHEFGIYSIGIAMVAVIAVIAESGTSSALLRRASDTTSADDQGAQIRAALHVKSRVTVLVAIPCTALLVVVLVLNRVPPLEVALITVLVVANIGPTLSSSIFMVGLQLTDRFRAIRWLDLGSSALRLALIAALWATGTATVPLLLGIALLTLVAQRVVEAVILRPALRGPRPEPQLRGLYWNAVRLTLPTSVMMVVGEQLVIVILTLVGNTTAIGQIAALGKYAAAFVLLNSLLMTIIAPLLARVGADRPEVLRQRILQVLGTYLAVAVAYVALSALLSPLLLALLGGSYRDLGAELVVISAGVAVSNLAYQGFGAINHARGWLRWSWTYVPALAVWLLVGLMLPLSTPLGAACFSASLSLPVAVSQGWRLVAGWRATRRGDGPSGTALPQRVARAGG